MVEENFVLECSEKLQNEGFYNCFWVNSFTTVYENFEFECSEMLQNEGILILTENIFSPWLKKILNLDALKCTRMTEFLIDFMEAKYFRTPQVNEIYFRTPPKFLEIFSYPPKFSKNIFVPPQKILSPPTSH